ncbi:MAG: radical SAM protein, partial [Spirillospora sp.]
GVDRSMPLSLCWSPIVRCNLRCPHCLDDLSVPEMPGADRRRIARILADADVLGVDISGGEPLLLRDLPALARRIACGGRAAVSVTTNGWHLTRRVDELATAVDAIRVSLDGPDEDTHDRIRGAGSFARAKDGVRVAVAAGLPVQIQTVLLARNRPHAQRMIDLAERLGAGAVTFLQMLPIGAGAGMPKEMLTDPAANGLLDTLDVPAGMRVRLRTRASAGGFTVVRADGRVWRNSEAALGIDGLRPLTAACDLALTARDGSA